MKTIRMMLVVILATFMLGACNNVNIASLLKPNQDLADGIKSYEEGDYKTALVALQKAQDPKSSSRNDQVTAHKYLAFINCVSGHEEQCRSEFRKALMINPSFDLKPAEAGHPVWGPIFRGEKAKFAK